MRVCVPMLVLDAFKGGNHLPLFTAAPDIEFSILTSSMKPRDAVLPSNISVDVLPDRIGPYYYGFADFLFARAVLTRYPPHHSYWKQFDVIHLNQTLGPQLAALEKAGLPVVYLVHHPVSVDHTLAVGESSFMNSVQWRLKYALLIRWQRQLCRTFSHIATVSHTVKDRLVADYGALPHSISVVPNGVDGDRFVPANVPAEFDVIALGSLVHPRKGFAYLLDVYRKLSDCGYRIADVGRRSEEQQRQLDTLSGVESFGTVDSDELLSLLQRSKALLSCSLYEGFGLSLIEALACGKPAFAFASGAVPEVLEPIDPELLIPPKDTNQMVQSVDAFLQKSEDEREQIGQRYRSAVLERYALSGSAQALKSVYETIIRA